MTARPLAPVWLAWAAVVLLGQPQAAAQPRVRLAQNQVGSDSMLGSAAGGASSGSARTPVSLQQLPAPSAQQPCCDQSGSAGTTLPALTVPSAGFDPYNCAPAVQPGLAVPAAPAYAQPYMPPPPTHRFRAFGDFLYLQPSGAAATNFAIPVLGGVVPPPANPAPLGPVATTDPGYEPGFRVGVGFQPTPMGEWAAIFTFLETDAHEAVSVAPGGTAVLRSLVLHPATADATRSFFNAEADSGVDMLLGDVEYRGVIPNFSGPCQTVRFILGGRYAKLEQDFVATFTNGGTIARLESDVDFEGAGPKIGLDGERRAQRSGFLVYGRGTASFIAGEFSANYTQRNNVAGVVATTTWEDDRIVPILDLEAGLGWQSPGERLLLSAGYLISAWFNVVSNQEFIRGVQTMQYGDLQDTLVFDGPVARAEIRF